jgi:hypothetical protein
MKWSNQFEGDSLTFTFMLGQMLSGRRTKMRIQIARTAGKEKKMGQREYPKGGKSKEEKK